MDVSYVILGLNFIYVCIIAIIFFTKKRVNNIETKIFSALVISNLLGLADNSDTAVQENKKSRQINGLVNE